MTDDTTVEIDAEALEDVLEELESAMEAGKTTLSHDTVRPSAALCATNAREAYRTLVTAHPDYELQTSDS